MAAGPAAIDRLDWADIAAQLDRDGYALLPKMLTPQDVQALRRLVAAPGGLPGVPAAGSGLGQGDFFHISAAAFAPLAAWRAALYRHLAPIANQWNERLGLVRRYPAELQDFLERNLEAGQARPRSCLIRMTEHDYLALHQRADGEHVFPLQCVGLLSRPGEDFSGGEFIMTEQRPRMQSRPMVLPLQCGDAALIPTAQRPIKGGKGYYRARLRHAIGRVKGGERIGFELFFHDAS